jgi:hypothetical protein
MRFGPWLAALGVLCGWPLAAWAQVCSSITHEAVSVDVRSDDWTAATIKVKPGDLVIVRAGGLVKIAHTLLGEVGPKGTSSGSGRLDMKIGTGKAIPVGDRWVGALRDPGTIQFRVNAERYQDNSGAYRVNVIVIPVGAFPADAKVEPE